MVDQRWQYLGQVGVSLTLHDKIRDKNHTAWYTVTCASNYTIEF